MFVGMMSYLSLPAQPRKGKFILELWEIIIIYSVLSYNFWGEIYIWALLLARPLPTSIV